MRKFAILVDGSNLYSTLKEIRLNMDYNKLLSFFDGELVRAFYFTAVPEDKTKPYFLRPLIDHLEYNGYSMVTKFTKEYYNEETEVTKIKGNMDIEIAIKAIDVAPFVSDIVLVTGDGDFCALVEHLQTKYGVKVWCMSTKETTPPMVSDELRRKCDYFLDLSSDKVRARLMRQGTDASKFNIFGGRS